MTNKISLILVGILVIIGFLFRLNGLSKNNSFWIDEASSATFARAILEQGKPILPTGYAANDYTTHFYLMALSFKLLGQNEFAARFPSIIFGSLTILMVYVLGRKLGGSRIGLVSAVLITFSVLEIVYSRQARSYQELQFFYLLATTALFVLLESIDNKRKRVLSLLFFIISFGFLALTHKFGLLFFFEALGYLVIFRNDILKRNFWTIFSSLKISRLLKLLFVILIFLAGFILFRYFNFHKALQETTTEFWANKFGFSFNQYFEIIVSHVKYYHSFFWRQYPHITLLAIFGIIFGLVQKNKYVLFFLVVFFVHFGFVTTRVFPQFVRYVYLVFPFFIILAAYFLVWLSDSLITSKTKLLNNILLIGIIGFLVINGNKFSIVPKTFYSLNLDMSEIPEPDFKSIYKLIKSKTNNLTNTIIIDNRTDASEWYLGEGKPDYYLIGPQELEPSYNLNRGVLHDPVSGAEYLNSLEKMQSIVKNNKQGFVVFEERALEYVAVNPKIIDYVKKNLKKETRIEHLPNNNLSIWPIELYSWGI